MIIDASFQFKYSDVTPKWTGNFWEYSGKMYRSLREMKSTVRWKIENRLTKKLLAEIQEEFFFSFFEEIQKEIDKEVIGLLS